MSPHILRFQALAEAGARALLTPLGEGGHHRSIRREREKQTEKRYHDAHGVT